MRGLWNVPTQMANQHGIGMVIWSVLVLVALSYPVGLISSKAWRSSTTTSWPGTRTLAAGMVLCFFWYTILLVDVILHNLQVWVTYSYAVVGNPFFNIFRVSSDVLVLFGVFRLAIRFTQSSSFPVAISHSIMAAEYWAGFLLWVLTLTRSFIFFALSFCWLSATVSVSAIDTLAKACYALDAGYTAIQFVGVAGGMSLALALWMGFQFVAPGRFQPTCYDEGAGMQLPLRELLSLLVRGRELSPWKALNLLALPCLVGRSFCEVVIAGTLSRDVVDIRDITLARHITHSVFTVGLFWALCVALPTERAQMDKWVDEAHADVRSRLTGLINERTQQGKLSAPDMKDLLDEMKNDPLFGRRTSRGITGAGQGSGAQQAMASREVEETAKAAAERYYLGVLRKQFTKWTPIQRWDTGGASGVDVFAIPTGWTRANHNIE
ncbi:hypothetical protein QBC37DRAFT_380611 [Rhypophila decipiens]|uniref:Uncharacterized protein n=1 Tax=Rhypophila decipiens TaxID=261697 RepID=A0AAN6Y077_9PEZI|nr:hypothetical protein QBC37DRAFT_380611 [Rhypophila decipiens]